MPSHFAAALRAWGLAPDSPEADLRAAIAAHGLVAECFEDRGDGTSRYPTYCARIHDPARDDLAPACGWGATGYHDALAWALGRFLATAPSRQAA